MRPVWRLIERDSFGELSYLPLRSIRTIKTRRIGIISAVVQASNATWSRLIFPRRSS